MTLSETDRLIRSLRQLLKEPGVASIADANTAAPAQQYVDLCSGVERRLEQCAVMLDQGDEQQAIQLAETPPPLLDLITLLSFDKAREWRDYCQLKSLPLAGAFDARIVQRLNAVYAKGINLNHPLYRDYRTYVMKGRLEEAVATLRSIVRLNLSDDNARGELERLEGKLLDRDLDQLSGALAKSDEQAAVGIVDRLDEQKFSGNVKPQGATWERGLAVRRERLKQQAQEEARIVLSQIEPLHAAAKWQAAGPMLAHVQALQSEHGFTFEAEEAQRLTQFREWLAKSRQEFSQQQAFRQSLNELEHLIDQGEQHEAAAGINGLSLLRAELAAMVERWRQVEGFGRPLPDGLEARYRKRVGLARGEISRLQRLRRNFWILGSAGGAIVCAIGIYLTVQYQKGRDLAGQINRLIAAREPGALEKMLVNARAKDGKLFEHAAVKAAAASGDSYIQSQHERQKELVDKIAALNALAAEQPRAFASQGLESIQALLDDVDKRKSDIAPEYQADSDAPLTAIHNRWEAFLAQQSEASNARFATALEKIENLAIDELSYRRAPAEMRRSLADLNASVEPLAMQVREPPVPGLKIRDDLATRLDAVTAKLTTAAKELAKYDSALAAMHNATTTDAYLEAVRSGQQSEMRDAGDLAASKRILALRPSLETLLAACLMPGDAEGWAFFKKHPAESFAPSSGVLDPERRIYDQLLTDSNIRNVYSYRYLQAYSLPSVIFSRGKLEGGAINNQIIHYQGSFYRPSRFPTVLNFEDSSLDGTVQEEQMALDSQAFLDLHFRELIDTAADRYAPGHGAPIHEFLDHLTRNTRASPLFKAFIFSRIWQLMQAGQRTGFWGLPYSPALVAHAKEVQRLEPPASGYWMVPEEIKKKEAAFRKLFAAAAKVSYAQQAKVLQAAIREAADGGLTFRGYADAGGQPRINGETSAAALSSPPDLWGWEAHSGEPARLFAWDTKEGHYKATAEPVPLTPLFAAERDPKDILRSVCKRLGLTDEEYKNSLVPFLPPLFK